MLASSSIKKVCVNIAALLQEERLRQKLSLTRLAEMAGLSRQMITFVEQGTRTPTIETLIRMTQALGIDLPKLIKKAQG